MLSFSKLHGVFKGLHPKHQHHIAKSVAFTSAKWSDCKIHLCCNHPETCQETSQTPLPLDDTIHVGGVLTKIILFSDFPEFVCLEEEEGSNMCKQKLQQLWNRYP